MSSRRLWSVLWLLLLLSVASQALAGGMPVRRIAPGDVADEYIVTLQGVALADVDAAAAAIAARVDGHVVASWDGLSAFWIRVPSERANLLFRDGRVKSVEQNARVVNNGAQVTGLEQPCSGIWCVQPIPSGQYPPEFQPHPLWHLARISHRKPGQLGYWYRNDGSNVRAYVIDGGILRFHQEFAKPGTLKSADHLDPTESPRVKDETGSNVIASRGGPDRLPSSAPHYDCGMAAPFRPTLGGFHYAAEYPWFITQTTDEGITDHGTGVGSVLGGHNVGVAKNVDLIPVKALGCNETRTIADLIQAAVWIKQQESISPRRPAVVSISTSRIIAWSNKEQVEQITTLERALEDLVDFGIPVIVAAGNLGGSACNETPQRLSRRGGLGSVVTVGGLAKDATTDRQWKDPNKTNQQTGVTTNGSNVGPCVDIIAPAEDIPVAQSSGWDAYRPRLNVTDGDANDNDDPQASSGTSYATPIVSGMAVQMLKEDAALVALLDSSNPEAVPEEIWRRLVASATVLYDASGNEAGLPLGDNSPNRVAYLGPVGIETQPQSVDFATTPAEITLNVKVVKDAPVGRFVWMECEQPSYEGCLERTPTPGSDPRISEWPVTLTGTTTKKYFWVRIYPSATDSSIYTDSAIARVSVGCAVIGEQPKSVWGATGNVTFTVDTQLPRSNYSLVQWYRGVRGNLAASTALGTGWSLTVSPPDTACPDETQRETYWARIRGANNCHVDSDVAQVQWAVRSQPRPIGPITYSTTPQATGWDVAITSSHPSGTKRFYLLMRHPGSSNWIVVDEDNNNGNNEQPVLTASSATKTADYKLRIEMPCGYVDSDVFTLPEICNVSQGTLNSESSVLPGVHACPSAERCGTVLYHSYPQDSYAWTATTWDPTTFAALPPEPLSSNEPRLRVNPQKHTFYRAKITACRGTNNATTVDTFPFFVPVRPVITQQPQSKTIFPGTSDSVVLEANGTDVLGVAIGENKCFGPTNGDRICVTVTAQWYLNGVPVANETDPSVRITTAGTVFLRVSSKVTFTGTEFTVSTDSMPAVVKCFKPKKGRAVRSSDGPALDPLPVPPGTAVQLSITEDTVGIRFEWYAGPVGDLVASTRLDEGASIWVKPQVTTTYWVRMTALCDSSLTENSDPVTVRVQCDPAIYTEPESAEVVMAPMGQSTQVATTVIAGGGGPFTYRWYIVDADGSRTLDGSQTGPTYTWVFPANDPRPDRITRRVQVDVLSTCGGTQKVVTSRIAALTLVNASQRIFAYSPGDTVYGSRRARLYVVMDPPPSADHVYSYEWFEDDGTLEGGLLAGSGSQMLVDIDQRSTFWCRVTGTHTVNGVTRTEVSISKKMYVWRYGACELPPLKITQSQYRVADDPEQKVVFTAVCDWPYAEFQWYAGQSGDTRQPVASDPNQPHQLTIGTGPVGPYWVRVSMECGYHEDGPTMTYERGSCGPLLINQNMASVDVEYGGTATLSVDPPAGATQYEWFQERYAGSIETTTVPQLTLPNTTESSRFYAVVSGSSCQRPAKTFVATVRVASCPSLSFLQTPMDMWVTKGVGGTLSVVANGATTYTWFIGEVGDDSQPIPGATSSSLAVNPVVDTKYWVRVSNGECDIDSPTATVTVCTPPALATDPGRNVNIQVPGQWVAFDVNMLGTDLAYQWYRGAPGDTSTPVGPAVNRLEDWPAKTTSYWVKVTGRCGTYQSQAFTASLCPRIDSIAAQPTVVMPNQNQTSTLSINAGTDPLLTYQWYSGPVGNTSEQYKVPNGTGPTVTTPVVNAPATFWCYVKSGECFTYSDPVTINLCSEPTVRWQQGDKNVTRGSSVWFYLDAAHSTTQPTITLYAGNKGDTTNKVYGPSTTEDFTLVVNETRKYWARAQVNNCWSDSEEITVRVCIPTITDPAGGNYTVGGTPVTLSVTSDIVPQNGYEWFIGEKGVTGNPVPNSNSASIQVTPSADTKYWVRAKGCTNVDSAAALVTVCVPAKVKSHVAVSQWIKKGATKELWVEPEGTGATVRWYRGSVGVVANPVSNATSAFVSPTDTTTYWARVTGGCSTATADTPAITVNVCDDPAISAAGQPAHKTIYSGARATLSVAATQSTSTAMTYQWYRGTTSGTGTLIEGATNSSYTTDPLTQATSYWVKVRASQSFCETNSSVATVSICPYAQEINAPADKDIAVGGTARLDLSISPVPQSYKWYRGAQGVTTNPISTGSYVDVSPTVTTQYWGEVTKDGCTSKTRTVTVYVSVPSWSQQPSSKTVEGGVATQLTASATPSDVTYQWYEGTSGTGTLVGTGSTLNVAGRAAGSVANFWIKVTGSRGHVLNSDTATVTWCTPPNITGEPADHVIRRGASTSLSVTATGTNLNYQWYRGVAPSITSPVGTNSSTLPNLTPTDNQSYWVRVSSSCTSVVDDSRTATISVCFEPTINTQPLSQTIYNNTSVRLSVAATANTSMPLTYQWYEGTSGGGSAIQGATNSYYDTPNLTSARNYWVKVMSGFCWTASNTAAIGICAYGPTVNAPADYYVFSGKQTLLKASISPIPSSGSWYRGAQGDRSFKISSQTQVYVYPDTTTQYWAEFVGSDGCKTMTRTVTVNVCVPTILEQPQSTTIPYGSSTTLSVTAREGVTYQWWKNDVPISGATSATLNTGEVWGETYYQVVITGSCGVSVNSAYATVGVY